MTDPQKQAEFIASLRKRSEEAASKNPILAELKSVGKKLVDETRRRIVEEMRFTRLGSYLTSEGEILLIESEATEPSASEAEMLFTLKRLANEGKIRAAAICEVIERIIHDGSTSKFINLHVEHESGAALRSVLPADESLLMAGVPGVEGPAVAVSAGPTQSKIFSRKPRSIDPNAPILKIAVTSEGRITVDGSTTTIDALRASLKRLAEQNGVVWLYREMSQTKGTPESAEIIKAVIENRLSIRLSSRPDYSDTIGPDGRPIPGS